MPSDTTQQPRSDWPRIIAHADMDAFYAAVEQRDNPQLVGKPLLIGPRSKRGVVLTASYEARPYKVGSAMPMAEALRRCPHAVVVPPRFDLYSSISAQIMDVFSNFSPDVEALSLDEAFLDMSGSKHIFGTPREMGRKIKQAVRQATGLTISVGVSHTKYVAKVASAFQKPDGLTVVPPQDAVAWLARLSVSRLWGAGPKTQARMQAAGYHTIGDIAKADPQQLEQHLGSAGRHFYALALAQDPRPVERQRVNRSMGSDRTLAADVSDSEDIKRHLRRSADRIARRLRAKGYRAQGVRVRLKTSTFRLLTRQCTLAHATDVADELYAAGVQMLERFQHKGPFRLVGLAAHNIKRSGEPLQDDLLSGHGKQRQLETVMDQITERFGDNTIRRARDVSGDTVSDTAPDLDFLDKQDIPDG